MAVSTVTTIAFGAMNLLTSVFVIVIFCVVKFNDLKHLDDKMQEVASKFDAMNKEVFTLSSKISAIEGYIKGKSESNF